MADRHDQLKAMKLIRSKERIGPCLTALKPCLGRLHFPSVETEGYDVLRA